MAKDTFVLSTGSGYFVENRYPAVIEVVGDNYVLAFDEKRLNIFSVAESADKSMSVIGAGAEKTARRRFVVTPSPLLIKEGPP
jgi:hypothetical protein